MQFGRILNPVSSAKKQIKSKSWFIKIIVGFRHLYILFSFGKVICKMYFVLPSS